jgi:hypothetical protein
MHCLLSGVWSGELVLELLFSWCLLGPCGYYALLFKVLLFEFEERLHEMTELTCRNRWFLTTTQLFVIETKFCISLNNQEA